MGENESQRWAERVIAVERERDEARAEAARLMAIRDKFGEPADLAAEVARWKAEAERLREALADLCDRQGDYPTDLSRDPEWDRAFTRARAALSAGGETDA